MPRALAEKTSLAHIEADGVSPGDIVRVECGLVIATDVSGPVAFRQMEKMGAKKVFDPEKVADHFMPTRDVRAAELQKLQTHPVIRCLLASWSSPRLLQHAGEDRRRGPTSPRMRILRGPPLMRLLHRAGRARPAVSLPLRLLGARI